MSGIVKREHPGQCQFCPARYSTTPEVVRHEQDAHAHPHREADELRKRVEGLEDALDEIVNWREKAREYDEEMQNPEREFCEDVELIADFAQWNLNHSRGEP